MTFLGFGIGVLDSYLDQRWYGIMDSRSERRNPCLSEDTLFPCFLLPKRHLHDAFIAAYRLALTLHFGFFYYYYSRSASVYIF